MESFNMKSETAGIINTIEELILRGLSNEEMRQLIDAIEFEGITDPKELITMFDLD